MHRIHGITCLAGLLTAFVPPAPAQSSFIHWETPHVSPLALAPDGTWLLAVNTADNRLEVFDATGALLRGVTSIPVGLDPVAVRPRTSTEVWVVNHVSDSISIVDLPGARVVRTLGTRDEPCDVVFAGVPERAFVSCSQANTIHKRATSTSIVERLVSIPAGDVVEGAARSACCHSHTKVASGVTPIIASETQPAKYRCADEARRRAALTSPNAAAITHPCHRK